jgi:hypothetical protein
MLARSGQLATRGDFAYEVTWDGFRAIVSTEGPLRVRSRRGWNMTEHVQFLVHLPVRAVLDGELVAFDESGKSDFPLVCERVLHRHSTVPLTYIVFDVFRVDAVHAAQGGGPVMRRGYRCRFRPSRWPLRTISVRGPSGVSRAATDRLPRIAPARTRTVRFTRRFHGRRESDPAPP